MYRIWVADLDSPSYFIATAAVELGFFKREGIDIEFVYNTREGPALLREGKLDFIGGPSFVGAARLPGMARRQAALRTRAVLPTGSSPCEAISR